MSQKPKSETISETTEGYSRKMSVETNLTSRVWCQLEPRLMFRMMYNISDFQCTKIDYER